MSKPKSTYAGAIVNKNSITVTIQTRNNFLISNKTIRVGTNPTATLISFFKSLAKEKNIVVIACGIYQNTYAENVGSSLWMEENISPFILKIKDAKALSIFAKKQFDKDNSYIVKTKKNGLVITPFLLNIAEYEKETPPDKFQLILDLSQKLKNKKISYFSATPQGGGVALMRHALMRFFKLLGFNAKWYVMKDDPEVFYITKNKFHNVFQNAQPKGMSLNNSDVTLYEKWSLLNYRSFKNIIKNSDIVVIDDPQPAGMIPLIRKDFKNKNIIFRLHIHMLSELAGKMKSEQYISWQYLYQNIKPADLFIFHPVDSFVPKEVDRKKTVMMGATLDYFDGLNKNLSQAQLLYYLNIINTLLIKSGQAEIDTTRPIITQIARFDPSKGIPDLLESFLKLRKIIKDEKPQLIVAGNSSIDDPDGDGVHELAMKIISDGKYDTIRNDIKIIRVPHNDFLLNAIMQMSTVYLQLSHKEGFEDKITAGLLKSLPVIVYDVGGMPLQVKDGISGYIVKSGDTDTVAKHLSNLLTDKKLYQKMKMGALKNINPDMNTQSNALYWLFLFDEIEKSKKIKFNSNKLSYLTRKKYGV